ncbi:MULTISPECIES: hypothetical protein [Kitasatospora]|uniref:Uncharacterized protein n=1 Tax=Kitasatospora setae (strain ATCC 33774 / DSM 43861 / JCM 3304 / KCC A-0304 / NBRC 14216 / KM-6054) TaxID=452652 RepID=E4NFC2_KITSK|nr:MULTISPECIES: hypothetical protein [Kitasatospora]BAJ30202.1 hypothetical protein KSE_44190 [Kitasatospora setae KM-6054]
MSATAPGGHRAGVALRTVLALYPAGYRRDRGDELAEVFADSTAGAGRLATAREALDLAGYGLRLRTGLSATALGGRLLAVAAPLLAGALAGQVALPGDLRFWRVGAVARAGFDVPWQQLPDGLALLGLTVVPVLLAVAAAFGAWRAARTLAGVVVLLGAVQLAVAAFVAPTGWLLLLDATSLLPYLAAGGMLLAVPAELLERPGRLLVAAGAGAGLLVTRAHGGYDTWRLMDGWLPPLLLLAPLLLVVLGAARGRLLPAAVGLAVLPLTAWFSLFSLWEEVGGVWRLAPVAVFGAGALWLAGRVSTVRQEGRRAAPGAR